MSRFLKLNWRKWSVAFLHDLVMVPIAWFGAYWLRFNLESVPTDVLMQAKLTLPLVMAIQASLFFVFGLYRGIWRFASMPDLMRILKAVAIGSGAILLALFFINRVQSVPRSILPLYSMLLVTALSGSRFFYRWLKDNQSGMLFSSKRALIIGAGTAGEALVRDLIRHKTYRPVAFLDDNPQRIGQEVRGIRVVGTVDEIPTYVKEHEAHLVLIAIPSITSAEMRKIVDLCEKAKVSYLTLPTVSDITSGRVSIEHIRHVSIEDLLGREPVVLDWHKMKADLSNKIILVSGAGGSIGSELCRQLAVLKPFRIIIVENCEYNLYKLEYELQQAFPELDCIPCLVNVCDKTAITDIFERYHPDIVFHAAAYKQVPILEGQARAAMLNNVFGTQTMAEASGRFGIDKFILISSDKAVHPCNIMGASKRIAELICQALHEQYSTNYMIVRFGNVLGSIGSVIPLFKQQIADGGPITVTHPDIQRYFMTIPEACQLIMQATVIGQGGEIYVLDMGEPVKIQYLAEQLIKLSGKQVGEDIEIVYTGLRPGEKLYEELFYKNEELMKTMHGKIFQALSMQVSIDELMDKLQLIRKACEHCDEDSIITVLKQLVPEYTGNKSVALEADITADATVD